MNASLRLLYLAALPATFALAFCSPVSRTFVTSTSTSSGGTGGTGGFGAGGFGGFGLGGGSTTGSTGSSGTGSGSTGSGSTCPMGETACSTGCTALTTATDCGACGRTCGAGSTCTSGFCTPVSLCTGMGSANLALLGTAAFGTAGQIVYRCDLTTTGGAATRFVEDLLEFISFGSIVSDPKNLYYVSHSSFSVSNPTDELEQSDGGASDAGVATDINDLGSLLGPAEYVSIVDDPSTANVFEVTTSAVYQLLIAQIGDAGLPSHTCFTVNPMTAPISNAIAGGGKLFAASSTAGTVIYTGIDSAGGCSTPTTLATGITTPGGLASDGTTVAFAGSSGVYSCNVALGCLPEASPTPLVTGQTGVLNVVMDALSTTGAPNLYWIGAQGLVTCSSDPTVCNGKPTVLVPNATPTSAIAVDSTYVYYVQGDVLTRVVK